MKYIPKPQAKKFANGLFGVPQFIDYLIGSDDEFNKNGEGVRSATRILKVLKKTEELHYVPLEDSDHARTKRAAEDPTKGYPTPFAWMCFDYLEAIANAKDEIPPEPEKKAEAEEPTEAETAN